MRERENYHKNIVVKIAAGKIYWWMLKLVGKSLRRNFCITTNYVSKVFINYCAGCNHTSMNSWIYLPPKSGAYFFSLLGGSGHSDSLLINGVGKGKMVIHNGETWQKTILTKSSWLIPPITKHTDIMYLHIRCTEKAPHLWYSSPNFIMSVNMRKHQTNPNSETVYKLPDQNFLKGQGHGRER